MALKINFNDRNILLGHLNQALPQVGLEEVRNRIIVGNEGGLAYTLFPDSHYESPHEFRAFSVSDMSAVKSYFDASREYVDSAGEHAKKYSFRLLSKDCDGRKLNELGIHDVLVYAVIGTPAIDSLERFERFLDMIKEGKGELDKQYSRVKELGARVKPKNN